MMSIGRGSICRGSLGRGNLRSRPMEPVDLRVVFGTVVRDLRKAKGYSQERFAAEAGIDRAYMGAVWTAACEIPRSP